MELFQGRKEIADKIPGILKITDYLAEKAS